MSERGQMRRRLREQLRVREALLLDLGALVYELHRQGKRAPELLQRKAAELTVVDEEVRELQAALDGRERPAGETTEDEAVAGAQEDALDEERPEDDALHGEPGDEGALDGEDGEREEERELREDELREDELGEEDESGGEDELRQEDASGGGSELRQEDVLGEEDELSDTGELDALAEEEEQVEGGDPGHGGREDEDSYDEPLVDREEPRG